MTGDWSAVPPSRVVELAAALVGLPWPVAEGDAAAELARLGWAPVKPGMSTYFTRLGVAPDVASATKARGAITDVQVNLVDRDTDATEARETFIQDTSGSYVLALAEQFGDPRTPPFPHQGAVSVWECPNGCRLTIRATIPMITLQVESPEFAAARRTIERTPDL